MATQVQSPRSEVAGRRVVPPSRLTTEKYDADDIGTDLWPVLKVVGLVILVVAVLGWLLT